MDTTAPVREARSHGHKLGQSRGFCWFARFGIAARGVVYIVIGVLAVKLALGDGGKATDQQGALQAIAKQPAGTLLLAVVAIGLLGYASWRLLRAALGGTQGQDDLKDRIDGVASGISYSILFFAAVKILARRRRRRLGPRQDDRRRARLARRPVDRRHRGRRS